MKGLRKFVFLAAISLLIAAALAVTFFLLFTLGLPTHYE